MKQVRNDYEIEEFTKTTFDAQFRKFLLPVIVGIVALLPLPYLLTHNQWFEIDFSKTGGVGDTIGGILTPFITIAATILTFFAFWIQFKANFQQREDIKKERFQNRFFEMLHLHKANVNEIILNDQISGRNSFRAFYIELRFIYYVVEHYLRDKKLKKEKILEISYAIFFNGIEDVCSNGFKEYKSELKGIKVGMNTVMKSKSRDNIIENPMSVKFNTEYFLHRPFGGNSNQLGHYYRHLFQTVKFITKSDLSYNEKYSYLKTLRAQLTNYEQILLFYNAMAWFNDEWKEIFTKYCFIKNINPVNADFYDSPQEKFKDHINGVYNEYGKVMFEHLYNIDIKYYKDTLEVKKNR